MKSKFIKTAAAALLAISALSSCMHSDTATTTKDSKADCKKGTCTKKHSCSKNSCGKNGCGKK